MCACFAGDVVSLSFQSICVRNTLLMLQHFRLFICQIQVQIFRLIYLRSNLLTALKKLRLCLFTPIYTTVINSEYSSSVSYLPPSDLGSIDLVL